MAMVTSAEVKAIVDTSITDLSSFIDTADLIVREDLLDKGLSNHRLRQIELYLAAHFTVLTDEKGGVVSERAGQASESYRRFEGDGLESTRYGMQAIALDTTKTLESTTRKTARLTVL